MDSISIRYGESLTLPIDTGDFSSVSADLYVGKPGETYVLKKSTTVTDGMGLFLFDVIDTRIPLGEYFYQINVTDDQGYVEKYPSADEECFNCEDEFPKFFVRESLDETEVS